MILSDFNHCSLTDTWSKSLWKTYSQNRLGWFFSNISIQPWFCTRI